MKKKVMKKIVEKSYMGNCRGKKNNDNNQNKT